MNKYLFLFIFIFSHFTLPAQINYEDSTSQIIGYWYVDDFQSYDVTLDKYKVKKGDTTSIMSFKYVVDITIKDSTANSYLIEWFYKDYEVESDDPLVQKLAKVSEDISVIIRTDEFGAIQEVVNWKEVRDYIIKVSKVIRKEYKKSPNIDKILSQTVGIYSTKESIQLNAIKDAIQFYSFHGGAYALNEEVTGELKFANNFGGDPFDVYASLSLLEINEEDDTSMIDMYQSVDSKQLTNATFDYLASIGTFGNEIPDKEEFPALSNETWTTSIIHGDTGWTVYSIETKEVKAEGTSNIEEREIKIR